MYLRLLDRKVPPVERPPLSCDHFCLVLGVTGTNIFGIASQFAMHFDPVCDAFSPVRCSNCDA